MPSSIHFCLGTQAIHAFLHTFTHFIPPFVSVKQQISTVRGWAGQIMPSFIPLLIPFLHSFIPLLIPFLHSFVLSFMEQVSTVRDWAEQTGGGGGGKNGRELPRPIQVEVVREEMWGISGLAPVPEENNATAATAPRLSLPPLMVGGQRGGGIFNNVFPSGCCVKVVMVFVSEHFFNSALK